MSLSPPRRLLLAALLAFPAAGRADTPDCDSIGSPVLYGAGGSAQRDLVGKAAVILENATNPIYVVYQDANGACYGLNALAGLSAREITGTAYYWDADTGSKTTCNLPLAGAEVQFAVMGTSPYVCPLVTDESLVEGIVDVTGPISAYAAIVPNASTQQSISAEAFYLVYGFGPAADIAPWNNADASYYLKRDENSAAQNIMALATGLPAAKFYGTDSTSNSNTVSYLAALAEPEQGIGFVSTDVLDANRVSVKALAWQQFDQIAGYWPDSDVNSYDKRNVRDGQYFLWNPIHLYCIEGSTEGSYADQNAKAFLGYLAGTSQPAGTTQTSVETAVLNHNIPVCAMNVARDGDLGPEYAVTPDDPCGCYFDYANTGATTCATCDDSTPCASGTCRYGFCEAY